MLDKKSLNLLRFINQNCSDGGYKIFTADEFIAAFSSKMLITSEAIYEILDFLAEREFIKLKYRDENSVCLCPLPKGRLFFETIVEKKKEKFSYKTLVIVAFVGSIIGGILGSFIANILSKLIGL